MEAKSQITQTGQFTRVCNSCRRTLNFCHFGTLWNGQSGFNSTCKICRSQSQKKYFAKTYQRKNLLRAKPPEFISALDQHNQVVLSEALLTKEPVEISGVSLLSVAPCRARVQCAGRGTEDGLRMQLFIQGDERPFTVESYTSNVETFTHCCLLIFREQSVRLQRAGEMPSSEAVFLGELEPVA